MRVNVEYPSLPPKCINCGKFGHLMNRCHKPPLKRAFTQKSGKVIKVVKAREDVSLDASSQKDEGGIQEEAVRKKRNRAHSRSRRRSRSRARVRALSAPVEELGDAVVVSSEVAVARSSVQKGQPLEEKGSKGSKGCSESSLPVQSSVGAAVQLEEGEIDKESEECEVRSGVDDRKEADLAEEVEALWFTKHSRNYRRALRQDNLWRASGAVGSPPKSSKFLSRSSTSGKKHGL